MSANPFIGQVIPWAPNFPPRGWAFCEGQLLSIPQYDALFSLLGTIYGGDGRTTFGLPDLRGRVARHAGSGPGLTPLRLGQRGGAESVTLTQAQLPSHAHAIASSSLSVQVTSDEADQALPDATHRLAAGKLPTGHDVKLWSSAAADTTLGGLGVTANLANTGGSQSHTNMQPSLAIRYIIALVGVFPSRS